MTNTAARFTSLALALRAEGATPEELANLLAVDEVLRLTAARDAAQAAR